MQYCPFSFKLTSGDLMSSGSNHVSNDKTSFTKMNNTMCVCVVYTILISSNLSTNGHLHYPRILAIKSTF